MLSRVRRRKNTLLCPHADSACIHAATAVQTSTAIFSLSFSLSPSSRCRPIGTPLKGGKNRVLNAEKMHRIRLLRPSGPSARLLVLTEAQRCIRQQKSPDRSFSEEIQDRQNRFEWARHHVFRPHQHFSYDPTSWSRPLAEAVKKERTLSLVERVKMEEERCAGRAIERPDEVEANFGRSTAAPSSTRAADDDDNAEPSYFFTIGDGQPTSSAARAPAAAPWALVALQEMMDEVHRLGTLLHSQRYTGGTSLRQRERTARELGVLLVQVYERLCTASLGETMSVEAVIYSWYMLLQYSDNFLMAVADRCRCRSETAAKENAGSAEAEAIHEIFTSMRASLFRPMEAGGLIHAAVAEDQLSTEALIEVISLVYHHFPTKYTKMTGTPLMRSETVVEVYIPAALRSLAARMAAEETAEAPASPAVPREWVDPAHVALLVSAMERCSSRLNGAAPVPLLCTLVGHTAGYLLHLLHSVTSPSTKGQMQEMLRRRGSCVVDNGAATPSETVGVATPSQVQPVRLDSTAAPRGIQAAPTEPNDTADIISAATALLRLSRNAAREEEEAVSRCIGTCLTMLSHAPNYDLPVANVVEFACELLDTGRVAEWGHSPAATPPPLSPLTAENTAAETRHPSSLWSLRFLLILSRLDMAMAARPAPVANLVLRLVRLPQPEFAVRKFGSEWRRLVGVVMQKSLQCLRASDLCSAEDDTTPWEEAMAFGEFGGLLPIQLWRSACEARLPALAEYRDTGAAGAKAPPCSKETAAALLRLAGRYVGRRMANGVPSRTPEITMVTTRYLAYCLAVLMEDEMMVPLLLHDADAWDAALLRVPETEQQLLQVAQQLIREKADNEKKVLTFS